MRLLTAMLLFGLTGSAIADDAKPADSKPAKLGLRVVKVLPESHQALLFDRNRGTHVLVEVGKTIDGYTVQDIDDDEVTLGVGGASVVLPAPEPVRAREGRELNGIASMVKPADPYAAPAVAAPAVAAPAVAAPAVAAPATPAVAEPVDPYADVRVAEAPKAGAPQPIVTSGLKIDPAVATVIPATAAPVMGVPATATATVAAPAPVAAPATATATEAATATATAAATATAPTTATVAAPATAPAPVPVPVPATAPAPAPATDAAPAVAAPSELAATLVRAEVDRALLDFGKLTSSVKGAFTSTGLRLDKLAEDSLYFKAGLRAGDIVTAVDGKALHTIDDAADLYARSTGVKSAVVQVIRSGKPMTLRVAIQ